MKHKKIYQCSSCQAEYQSWSGKCSACGEWNTLVLQPTVSVGVSSGKRVKTNLHPKPLVEIIDQRQNAKQNARLITDDRQLNNVMGGGFVRGSVSLLAGDPGIGKSTILMQIAAQIASKDYQVLYVSGEESEHQVASRAQRLGARVEGLDLISANSADQIAALILSSKYDFVVIDSIQTMLMQDIASAAGNVSQITNCTQLLVNAAKSSNSAMVIVGHVTKVGSIAGPKILEHSVDVVLQFEGDRFGGFKLLRSTKNRFGSTDQVAIYEMFSEGLRELKNPSAAMLEERQVVDGSVVLATMEGVRPILVEIQALVNNTIYGNPKRTASGFDTNRMNLLIAMLEKRTKLTLNNKDVYLNVVGGLKISEPAADLAVAMAIASAAKGLKLKDDAVVFGELGLSGELRRVIHPEKRLVEAKKLGFSKAIGPKIKTTISAKDQSKMAQLYSVGSIREALNSFLKA